MGVRVGTAEGLMVGGYEGLPVGYQQDISLEIKQMKYHTMKVGT